MTTAPDLVDRRPNDGDEVDLSITVDAPPDVVFDFLVVPELAFRWMGVEGEIDPRPGGVYRVRYTENDIAVGAYVDVTRPHTVSWTWGWEGSDTVPPGSTLVTFSLRPSPHDDTRTEVTVRHTGFTAVSDAAAHTDGWVHWATRFAVAAAGGDPDVDAAPSPDDDREDPRG